MREPATIKIFLPQGDPKKVRTAELSNWWGKAIAAPRSEIEVFLARPELNKPGVYILLGVDPSDGKDIGYIGESDCLAKRIKQHKAKDDWNSIIAFVSMAESLTKSHILYLEGRLIQIASSVGRYKMTNQQPSGAHLPESDQSDMEIFLSKVMQLLPVLGTEIITPIVPISNEQETLENLLYFSTKGVSASGKRTPNGFVVFKGSSAVIEERNNEKLKGSWVLSLRNKLRENGSLVEKDTALQFTKDVEFGSPSSAAAVIQGGSAQGTVLWKNKDGKTLKEIES